MNRNWHKEQYQRIKKELSKIEKKKIISKSFVKKIREFIEKNHEILKEQNIGLVYWDVHFDNFLVINKKISGVLDFERTELLSIDYPLHLIRRMVNYPKIYVSEDFEKFIRKKDYANLLKWYKEFYPELFSFKKINKRIDLYSIEHDLNLLNDWPKVKSLKKRLAKIVGYKI